MFKKIATVAAASALVFASAANAAGAASLSLSRASTVTKKESELVASPAFLIGGILGALVVLEVTGAINIIGDDDSDSN